jgi:anaerobic magnesium-protoporphyrin IX monomethyl ester cyclase
MSTNNNIEKKIKKIRMLLINPFFLLDGVYDLNKVLNNMWDINEPLGLESISTYIIKELNEVEVEVYDANLLATMEIFRTNKVDMESLFLMVEDKIKEYNPDVVGVSALFEFCGDIGLTFINLAKKISKDIITIMGGAYASFSYESAFKCKNLDYIIKGEGEDGAKQFIEYLLKRRRIEEVVGLIYREKNTLKINPSILIKDINNIPPVSRNEKLMDTYVTRSQRVVSRYLGDGFVGRIASVMATRGCQYKCAFCSTKELWGRTIRYREVDSVINEIKMLKDRFGVNVIRFDDDALFTNPEYSIDLLKKLKRENIRWFGSPQISVATETIIKLCIESGVVLIGLNPESGSDNTLKKINKPLRIKKTEQYIKMVRSVDPDIYIYASWVVGFPFESMDDIKETHDFAKSLDLDWSAFYCFTPYPGTQLYDECLQKGIINKGNKLTNVLTMNAISTDQFTADELLFHNYCANIDINFLNNRNMTINPERAVRDFEDMIFTYPTHVFGYYCLSRHYFNHGNKQKGAEYLNKAHESANKDSFYMPYIKFFGLERELCA